MSCEVTAQIISAFVFALHIEQSEISIFQPASVTVQADLCRTWSEPQIVGSLEKQLLYDQMLRCYGVTGSRGYKITYI